MRFARRVDAEMFAAEDEDEEGEDEDEVEEEPSADEDDEDGEGSSGKRETFEEDDEDNTLSLAAMEELLKPDALEKFAAAMPAENPRAELLERARSA